MRTVTFKAGDTIISEGDEGDTAFLIVSGSTEVSVGEGNRLKVLATPRTG
jgi:CRP/FNR family transcriptional regulator, cyclic AMP receptor protein